MGSSSSRSNANQTTTTTTETQNVNLQGTLGTNVFTDGNVSVTDGGAIEGSLNIGRDAVAGIAEISQAFLTAQEQVNKQSMSLSGQVAEVANKIATDDTAETIQTLVKWGAGAAIAVAGVYYFSKGN
jgi:hypothetical protein